VGLGGGVITSTSLAVRIGQYSEIATRGFSDSDASFPLLAGAFAGIAVGAFFGWRKSAALENISQRGVIAVLSAVGALLVAFILSLLADYVLGLWGVAALAAASITFGILGGRWAARGAGRPDPGQREAENA
jgi:NhaP-type Na+/H+ or K+/H+ antiporter